MSTTNSKSWLTEGIILAGLSAYAYLIAFFYELGYCAHFNIPSMLIAPNLSTLLVSAAAVGGTLLTAINYISLLTPLFKAVGDPKLRAYRYLLGLLATLITVGILIAAIHGVSFRGFIIYVIASAVFLLVPFLPVMLSDRHLTLKTRFENHADLQDNDPFQMADVLVSRLGKAKVIAVLLAISLLCFTYLIGGSTAINQERFMVLKSDTKVVILRVYGDLIIATTLGKAKNEVSDDIRLMWLSEKKDLVLLNAPIGPLKLATSITQSPQNISNSQSPTSAAFGISDSVPTTSGQPSKLPPTKPQVH